MKAKHNHPLFIIKQILFMMKQMILPVLAVFFASLRGWEGWIIALGIGALLLTLLIFAVLTWKNTFYYIENDVLFYQKGFLSKSKQGVSIDKITTINENQELIERIFRLSTFKVDAGSVTKGNEIKLTISKKEAEILKEELGRSRINADSEAAPADDKRENDRQPALAEYHIGVEELILYAIASNSFFAGLIFVLAVWQFIDDIPFVKDFIEGFAGDWVNRHIDFAVEGLSAPAIITAVLLILFAYIFFSFIISIVIAVVKYYDFKVSRQGDKIEITYGLLEKKRYHLTAEKITALYFKHGLIGQFCKIGELKIESIGYGDEKGEAAILYPVIKDQKRAEIINALLPEYAYEDAVCKPPKRALKSFLIKYTGIPFIIAMIVSFAVPYGAFSWIAVVLFCIAGLVSYKRTRISCAEDLFVLMGGALGKWTTVIKTSHIQAINSRQSFFQKRSGLIHLEYSYQSNNFGKQTGVQFLDQKEAAEMMKF
jgi:putative membrane protein